MRVIAYFTLTESLKAEHRFYGDVESAKLEMARLGVLYASIPVADGAHVFSPRIGWEFVPEQKRGAAITTPLFTASDGINRAGKPPKPSDSQ